VIVSASRRTDVPAFHSRWLQERLAAGWVDVRNPFRPSQVRRVDLTPAPAGPVEALVLWTRDPAPLLPEVDAWERRGVRTLWLVTLTGYPRVLEPRVPAADRAVAAVRKLAARVGPERVSWRYDPILVSGSLGMDASWHARNFQYLAEGLGGAARRCIVSCYDDYAAARRRLAAAGVDAAPEEETASALEGIAAAASGLGLELQTCCDDDPGGRIRAGACIDGVLLDRLWGTAFGTRGDPGQRKGCRCAPSVDIGTYGTCGHDCLYCYARRDGPGRTGRNRAASEDHARRHRD